MDVLLELWMGHTEMTLAINYCLMLHRADEN